MDSDRTFKQEQNRSRGLHYLLICVEIDTVYAAFWKYCKGEVVPLLN